MVEVDADIWVLQNFDYDRGGHALTAFALAAGYPHHFAFAPNTGRRTGVDLDGNGRIEEARDAQGFGWFPGQGGMAILSRLPVSEAEDFSALIWAEVPWATLPSVDGVPFPSKAALEVQRLSTTGHWRVAFETEAGPLTLLTAHATPPVFDGPEDRNGFRNADEVRLLSRMAGDVEGPFVIAGDLNLDPMGGDGQRDAIVALLADPRISDPTPGETTVDFGAESAGALRASYVLPSSDLDVIAAGVAAASTPEDTDDVSFTRHHPVWVDIEMP